MPLDPAQSPFDTVIDRRGTRALKWDMMEARYGVSPDDGIAMWVADMDFAAPDCVRDVVRAAADHGVFGYYSGIGSYEAATRWWMETRHGWSLDDTQIHVTQGLVNAIAMLMDTFTAPRDEIVIFAPVYHAFARVIAAAGRTVKQLPLAMQDGVTHLDFDRYDSMMTGHEKMMLLCSPHNPTGRVWSADELRAFAAFAERHDLILVADEIHHDLVLPGHRHIAMPLAAPEALSRLVMLTAPSKTFNIAGLSTGNVIIPDRDLNARFAARMSQLNFHANMFGLMMQEAAYSPEGAAWVDELVLYLDGNRAAFAETIAAIPGARMSPLEATYLAWVDFTDTGMDDAEILRRVSGQARIAVNAGETFGPGGERCLRFNLGTPRSVIDEACARLSEAFSDLQ